MPKLPAFNKPTKPDEDASPSRIERSPSLRAESISSSKIDFPPKDRAETLKNLMTAQKNKSTIFTPPFGTNAGEHHSRLGEHAKNLWQYHKITDLTVKLQGKEYACHKTVLSCYAKYFKDLLLGSKTAVTVVHLKLPSVTIESFEVLLTYMYTSELHLTCQNIGEVYTASRKLGMDGALILCKRILTGESKYDVHSVYVYVTAKKQRLKECAAKALKVMTRRFELIVGTPEFLDLDVKQVVEYLSQDVLATRSEAIVYLAALKWLSVKFLEREQHAADLIDCVRFQMMTLNEVLACYSPPLLPGILEEKVIRDTLLAATCYVSAMTINEEKRFSRYSCKPRKYLLPRETIILWDPSIFDPDRHAMYVEEMAATTIQAAFRGYKTRQSIAEDIAAGRIHPLMMSAQRENLANLDAYEPPIDEDDATYTQKQGTDSMSGSKFSLIDNIRKSVVSFITGNESVDDNAKAKADQQKKNNKKIKDKEEMAQKRQKKSKEKASAPPPQKDTFPSRSSSIDTLVGHVNELAENTELKKYVSDTAVDISSEAFRQSFTRNESRTFNKPIIDAEDRKSVNFDQTSSSTDDQSTNERPQSFIIVAGGFRVVDDKDKLGGKSMFLFDPSNEKWQTLQEMEKARLHHGLVCLNEELYFIGGCNAKKMKDEKMVAEKSCYKLELRSKKWSKISKMLYCRVYHGVAELGGKIYAIGGRDDSDRTLDSAEVYNPASNKWEELDEPLETPMMGLDACEHQGKLWVVGGIVEGDSDVHVVVDNVTCYDPDQKLWSKIKPLPHPRAFATIVSFKEKLYVIGGTLQWSATDPQSIASVSDVLYYDNKTSDWAQTTSLPSSRHSVKTAVIGNTLYVLGGIDSRQNTTINEVLMYQKEFHKWRLTKPLPMQLSGFAAAAVPEAAFK